MRNTDRHLALKRFPVIRGHRFGRKSLSIGVDRLTKPIKFTLQSFALCHRFLVCGAFLLNVG